MSKYNDFEHDYRDDLEDLYSEDLEVEENGLLSFKSFLLNQNGLLDDKIKSCLKRALATFMFSGIYTRTITSITAMKMDMNMKL